MRSKEAAIILSDKILSLAIVFVGIIAVVFVGTLLYYYKALSVGC